MRVTTMSWSVATGLLLFAAPLAAQTVVTGAEVDAALEARATSAEADHAADLGNTPATCRSFYIHPGVLAAYEEGSLEALLQEADAVPDPESAHGLQPEERRVLALLPWLEDASSAS